VDFLEQWTGVSPDGGSGSLEVLLLSVLLGLLVVGLVRRSRRDGR
jgi:hypothetical protein